MIYTDLAIESAAALQSDPGNAAGLSGVTIDEDRFSDDVLVTRIVVEEEEAARRMGKPCGSYITIESKQLLSDSQSSARKTSRALARELSRLIPFHDHLKVLAAGIGNEKITPDSLGPHTVSKIRVTRHLFLMYDCDGDPEQSNVCAINPGVMAQTGVETAEILRRIVDFIRPDALLAVDSLAARDIDRMNTTIQMTDTGISPGAGANNRRAQLTKDTVGCPVIAIGVPTVIHCETLLQDSLPEAAQNIGLPPLKAPDLIVTAANIDQVIHSFSSVIAEGIDFALHPGLYPEVVSTGAGL